MDNETLVAAKIEEFISEENRLYVCLSRHEIRRMVEFLRVIVSYTYFVCLSKSQVVKFYTDVPLSIWPMLNLSFSFLSNRRLSHYHLL